jgi:segregation and condensation protein A
MEIIKESLSKDSEEFEQDSHEIQETKHLVGQEEVHDLLFKREIAWQDIIYDLINTEQLDPWNVNLIILTEKYLEKIYELDEQDFFISSQVMLAAALLLRIKSEILLNKHLKSIDDILFNRNQDSDKKYSYERIELEEEIPELVPRSPMPRFKRVTLQELMESLNKAIITENRRIKKEIINKNAIRESSISLPKKTISIRDKIKEIFELLTGYFKENEEHTKIAYSIFVGLDKQKRIEYFSPLLHLENQKKIWLEQKEHFKEIDIWMKKTYIHHYGDPFADLKTEFEEEIIREIQENEDAEIEEEVELLESSEKGSVEIVKGEELIG